MLTLGAFDVVTTLPLDQLLIGSLVGVGLVVWVFIAVCDKVADVLNRRWQRRMDARCAKCVSRMVARQALRHHDD